MPRFRSYTSDQVLDLFWYDVSTMTPGAKRTALMRLRKKHGFASLGISNRRKVYNAATIDRITTAIAA